MIRHHFIQAKIDVNQKIDFLNPPLVLADISLCFPRYPWLCCT